MTDNWEAHFLVFCVFLFFVCFCWFLFCLFFEGLRVRWGGPKGHLTWPYTWKRHLLVCPPLFLLSLFWPPLFQFLFLCLSLSLSCSFFLLPSFLSFFVFFWFLVFFFSLSLSLSLSFFFSVFFAFVSWKEQHQKIKLQSFFSSILCFFVSCLVFSLKSLFLIFVFDFKLCFLAQHECFGFQNKQVTKHKCLVKRGVATKGFFISTCVLQNAKSYHFWGALFLANVGWCSKKHN